MLGDLGVGGEGRLLLEREARSTWENAVYAKQLAQPRPGERWLLVTSAAHMPRAIAVFRKVGFAVEPWPSTTAPPGRRTPGACSMHRPGSEGETVLRE
jgi:uncharacterized SAM-binding protein YcdF (DUF218 family)